MEALAVYGVTFTVEHKRTTQGIGYTSLTMFITSKFYCMFSIYVKVNAHNNKNRMKLLKKDISKSFLSNFHLGLKFQSTV